MPPRIFLPAFCALLLAGCAGDPALVVGSKQFTESQLLGEMAALTAESLEARVNRKFYMGGMVCFESLKNGDMDLYAEYTGTGLVNILGESAQNDPQRVYARVRSAFREKWGLIWLAPLGFNNTYSLAVRRSFLKERNLSSISGLAKLEGLRCGFDLVFSDRPDGYPGLRRAYGRDFCAEQTQMDPGLMYRALAAGRVDAISAYATDGRIKSLGLAVLEDDRKFFPPYHAAFLARPQAFKKVPGLREKLEALSGAISDAEMARLNAEVDLKKRPAREVARAFLAEKGFLKYDAPREGERTFLGFFKRRRVEILRLAAEHVAMVSCAMTLGVLCGVPLGVLLTRRRRLAPYILGLATALQTIPSVALLGLLMLLPVVGGIGTKPAIVALFLYSLLAIVENTYVGIDQVDPDIIDAGRGMGMTDRQILRMIEFPQALPVIIAGVRISAVISVATATIASYIGAGGLGDLIFRGVARANNAMVAWGAVPAILMSLLVHRLLTLLQRRLQARADPKDSV